ncbi:type II CAAX endopeptidase family protein [Clostridium sp. MCC353]|uniref:CPBP family intramembrane glutamic endopeptidase n=1 Tax=Clostridium sp. MCC353 TaxID=2592646 RepID=UPI001C03A271|nr:type II CAAX endopeptidase family protein [Clostridium sp. MCC353]
MSDRKRFSRIGLIYFVYFGVTILLQLLIRMIIKATGFSLPENLKWMSLFLSTAPMYLIAMPLTAWLFGKMPAQNYPGQKLGAGRFWVIFIIGMSAMQIGNLMGQGVMYAVKMMTGKKMNFELQEIIMNTDIWVVFIIVVLVGPVIEEYLFRRLLVDRIRMYGEGTAVLVSGFLFGVSHGNFYQFFYAFALGAILAYVYCKTSRLRYSVIMHMMINSSSVILLLLMKFPGINEILNSEIITDRQLLHALPGMILILLYELTAIGMTVGGIVLFICFFRKISFEKGERALYGFQKFKTIFCNVGMVLFLAVCIASAFV